MSGNSRQFSSFLLVEVMAQMTSQVALAAIKFHLECHSVLYAAYFGDIYGT